VGQDAVVRTLTTAIESGKLAHAYLFSGPRGSGKTSAAKILARCINCVHGPTPTPDNTCENCRAMLAGTALDVLEIDAASNRGIDEIRALRDAVKFAPAAMRMKVYIIDEAHMLTKEGANAFLKTLEEPPAHACFILATTEPEKLPITILSRCQRYAFRRIAIPVMIERMKEIARSEEIEIDDEALAAIAYRADGGLRDALTMLEQAAAFAGGEPVGRATLDLAFGATGRDYALALLDAVVARDAAAALAAIEEASDAGTEMAVLTRALIAGFRNLLVARVDPALLARDLAPEDAERAAARAKSVAQAVTVRALRVLSEALALTRSGGNPRLELETALLRLILSGEDPSLEALATRLAVLESNAPRLTPIAAPAGRGAEAPPKEREAEPEPVREAKPVSAAPPEPVSLQRVRAAWQSVRSKVEGGRPPLRGPLSRAQIDGIERDTVTLKLPDSVSAERLRASLALIQEAILDVLGVPLKVALRVDANAPAAKASSRSAREASAEEDPDELFNYASERIKE